MPALLGLSVLLGPGLPGQGLPPEGGSQEAPPGRSDPKPAELPGTGVQEQGPAGTAAPGPTRVIVTATTHAEQSFDLPYEVELVACDLAVRQRIFQDALKGVPGVAVQRTSVGQTSPYLRGFTGYHTLLLIDGIRFNNSVLRSGPNEYWGLLDGRSLDRIELVMGSSSVLYGSDSVGGTVQAITLRRKQYGPESSWERRLFLRLSSAERSITGRAQVSGNVGEDLGYVLGATGADYGNLHGGHGTGRLPDTGYDSRFADAHFDLHLDDHWSVGVLGQAAWMNDVNRVHSTVNAVPFEGTTVGSDLRRRFDWRRELAAVFLQGQELDGFFDEARVILSFQHLDETRDRIRSNMQRTISGFDVSTVGVRIELTTPTTIGRLTYGADWYHDFVDSFGHNYDATGMFTGNSIQGPVGDDASYDLLGVFIQDEIPLTDAFELILGARFTYASADARRVADPVTGLPIPVTGDWTNLSGSLRGIWKPDERFRIFGGLSQAFRAPNLSDLTRLDSARTNEIEVPSPGLDPERFVTVDLGARVDWEGFSLQAAYFYTQISDLIIRQPTGAMIGSESVVTKRSDGRGHLQGIDIGASCEIDDHWSLYGTFSWIDGQELAYPTSAPVAVWTVPSRLPPVRGLLGIAWQTEDEAFRVSAEALMVAAQHRLSPQDVSDTSRIPPGGTPGYTIFSVTGAWRPDPASQVFLSVENLANRNYRTHGSGVNEPGINIILGADITF